jgi:hemoglobin
MNTAMKAALTTPLPPTLARQALLAVAAVAVGLALTLATPARAAGDDLYQALGAKPGLVALMNDFVLRLKADARIGSFFKDTKATHLSQQLVDQVCVASGGPCVYEGAPMLESHRDLEITKADFNALVEVLQLAMDARGLPFATQNRLLALLAPLHRQIVTR